MNPLQPICQTTYFWQPCSSFTIIWTEINELDWTLLKLSSLAVDLERLALCHVIVATFARPFPPPLETSCVILWLLKSFPWFILTGEMIGGGAPVGELFDLSPCDDSTVIPLTCTGQCPCRCKSLPADEELGCVSAFFLLFLSLFSLPVLPLFLPSSLILRSLSPLFPPFTYQITPSNPRRLATVYALASYSTMQKHYI